MNRISTLNDFILLEIKRITTKSSYSLKAKFPYAAQLASSSLEGC